MISNRGKSVAFLLLAGAYGIGFLVIWKRFLAPWLHGLGWDKSNVPIIIGLLVLVGSIMFIVNVGAKFDNRVRQESRGARAAESLTYENLWRGGEHLWKAFGWWCMVSTILAATAGQKLTYYLTNSAQLGRIIPAVAIFGLMIGLYFVSAVGTWRSAGRYSGPKVWVVLSKIGVLGSVVLVIGAMILGLNGFNLFGE